MATCPIIGLFRSQKVNNMSDLHNPIFQNEDAAREYLEANRWEDGPYCPHCGETNRIHRLEGSAHRKGLWQCNGCRSQFSVTVGTVFERSKVPLHKWLLTTHLLMASKKGVSAHQLHRMLGVTYKTAWFMVHRLREALKGDSPGPMGGLGSQVEADETYIGSTGWQYTTGKGWHKKHGQGQSKAIVALVERDGRARAFHVDKVNSKTLRHLLVTNVSRDSTLNTDELTPYQVPGQHGSYNPQAQGLYGLVSYEAVE